MVEFSKDNGVITMLIERFETQRLPRALELESKVKKGGLLDHWDMEFLQEVLKDAKQAEPLVNQHPECQKLYARAVDLYHEITNTALRNADRQA